MFAIVEIQTYVLTKRFSRNGPNSTICGFTFIIKHWEWRKKENIWLFFAADFPMVMIKRKSWHVQHLCLLLNVKETVSGNFPWIIFPQAPANNWRVISNFFRKFAEIFASQYAPRCQRQWQITLRLNNIPWTSKFYIISVRRP